MSSALLDLLDYRRQVSVMYARVRENPDPAGAWSTWTAERDSLFATHPQTPLDDPSGFDGLPYFDYDKRFRTQGVFLAQDSREMDLANSGGGATSFEKIGSLEFTLLESPQHLEVYWLRGYAGGLFVPFRDLTNGSATYGGGRYLLDTAKGADLGHRGETIVLDFNFAYNPSCVHSNRWSCPLSPPANRLEIAVQSGERINGGP